MVTDTQTTLSYLALHCGSDPTILLPLESLAEILPLTMVVPMPGMPDSVVGICNWRGEVVWLLDINLLLGRAPLYRNPQPNYSAVILNFGDRPLGLMAHQVGQIQKVISQQIDHAIAKLNPLLLGSWQGCDVLDPVKLETFFNNADSIASK